MRNFLSDRGALPGASINQLYLEIIQTEHFFNTAQELKKLLALFRDPVVNTRITDLNGIDKTFAD